MVLLIPQYVWADSHENSGNDSETQEEQSGNNSEDSTDAGGNQSSSGGGVLKKGLGDIQGVLPGEMPGTQGNQTIGTFVVTLINWFLGILGVVFIVIVLYAGFKYMRSGNAQGTQEATSLITNAIIGLIIIMGAFLITQYVAGALT